jgi:hypothetical protein
MEQDQRVGAHARRVGGRLGLSTINCPWLASLASPKGSLVLWGGPAAPNNNGPEGPCHARACLGWLMGLEPTTTRITIWDSTN